MTALLDDPARAAVAEAAASRLQPGMTLGLGSGRAVWALLEVLATRWAGRPTRVAVASSATEARATAAGFEVVPLDGNVVLDCASETPFGPRHALLGTVDGGEGVTLNWDDAITENPAVGATEVWEMYNFTEDAHPIHIHEVQFEVIGREALEVEPAQPLQPWEIGARKDTVIAYPDEITRVKATFDLAGLYVWHCHIVEHEDNEMMRPYRVGP